MKPVLRYLHNFGVGLDQFVNAITGGDPDETISSRLGKYLASPPNCKACKYTVVAVCWFLDLFQKDHCLKSVDATEGKDAIIKNK